MSAPAGGRPAVRTGRGRSIAVLRCGPLSVRWHRRSAAVCLALLLLCAAVLLRTLTTGDLRLGAGEVVAALTGRADGATRTVVVTWRLPAPSPRRSSGPDSAWRAPSSSP